MMVEDLPLECLDVPFCGIDTETTGLDPTVSKPVLFQFYSRETGPYLVRIGDKLPSTVTRLLKNRSIKIAHYLPFDMAMLYYNHKVMMHNAQCTWTLSKLINLDKEYSNSYAGVCKKFLGVEISKEERLSDWTLPVYSEAQINYAIRDVQYLPALYEVLLERVMNQDKYLDYRRLITWLPQKVAADYELEGFYDRH